MATKIINRGTYGTLVSQLDKLARHNRQGSFRTRERYYEAVKRFCAFLADEYHLQKLENISGKHLTSYVLHMQGSGKSASTIKADLAAIRFFHDKMSRPKYQLPTNDELAVEWVLREYADYENISEYALEAMGWAVREGLVTGTSSTTLAPDGSTIRAQVATIFQRFIENVVK